MRLKEDSDSWKAGGIKRRDFRHDPGLPETEVTRHKGQRSKKKHDHKYGEWVYLRTEKSWFGERHRHIRTCQTCGHKQMNPLW